MDVPLEQPSNVSPTRNDKYPCKDTHVLNLLFVLGNGTLVL